MSGLTVVINQHQELCALHKPGGAPVATAELLAGVQHAASIAPKHLLLLEQVLHEHAMKLAEAAEVLRRTGRAPSARAAAGDAGPMLPQAAADAAAPAPAELEAAPVGAPAAPAPAAAGKKKKKRARKAEEDDEEETVTVRSAFEKA